MENTPDNIPPQTAGAPGSALDVIAELLEIVKDCNPQDPELESHEGDDCPVDHPGCCGRCEIVHRARAFLKAGRERAKANARVACPECKGRGTIKTTGIVFNMRCPTCGGSKTVKATQQNRNYAAL